jgi:hypothetical protein
MAFDYIDFIVASSIFLIFVVFLFNQVLNYISNYRNVVETSELKEIASIIFNSFFTDKGLPENWEEQSFVPSKIGLIDNFYLTIINVTDLSGSLRENITINGSINFDPDCNKNIWNNTLKLYDSENSEIPFQLYNQSFCEGSGLKKGEIVFNLTLLPHESKIFFLYFSSEKNVVPQNYSLDFPVDEVNYTFEVFPVQEFQAISIDKLMGLRNLSYEEVIQTIPKGYNFRVEIS